MTDAWSVLARDIAGCRICAQALPLGPRPIFAGSPTARLLIISQAPGRRAHLSGVPFSDASGDRLRDWLGLDKASFYNSARVAIMPMGFCYPGSGSGGDKLPDPICAATWHGSLRALMPGLGLTLLVGGLAQRAYLKDFRNVTNAVSEWRRDLSPTVPLPHPSWHNNAWLRSNSWFEAEILPVLRARISALLN